MELGTDDIIKITNDEGYVTLGRVVAVSDDAVAVYRSDGDVWYSTEEYRIERLGSMN